MNNAQEPKQKAKRETEETENLQPGYGKNLVVQKPNQEDFQIHLKSWKNH